MFTYVLENTKWKLTVCEWRIVKSTCILVGGPVLLKEGIG